jgi:hypothetical protein
MSILVALLMTSFGAATPSMTVPNGGNVAGGDCPVAHAEAKPRILNLLNTPFLSELRARFDLGTADAGDVEPLTNDRDTATCRALWQAVRTSGTRLSSGDSVSFYRSGNRFFVPIKRDLPSAPGVVIRLDGNSSVDVYDAEYRLVGRFAA